MIQIDPQIIKKYKMVLIDNHILETEAHLLKYKNPDLLNIENVENF